MSNETEPGTAQPAPATRAERLRHWQRALRVEVWHRPLATIPRSRRPAISLLRMGAIVARDFVRNKGDLQASALTFISLMSMVPVLAIMFAASKGLGAHEKLMAQIESSLARLPPAAGEFAARVFEAVDRTNFGRLGAIGVLLLFWTVVSVMGQTESAFNTIWHVRTPRTLIRRFQCYISILIVVPVLLLAATTLNTLLSSSRVILLMQQHFGPIYSLYTRCLGLVGVAAIIAAFTLLYLFMPNTKVRWWAALGGATVAGILWTGLQWTFIASQVWVTKYNAIYGTFAAIPIFLFWLQLNWYIVIAGAEFSFAIQNHDNLELVFDIAPLSFAEREGVGLLLMEEICAANCRGAGPWPVRDSARRHGLPLPLVDDLMQTLTRHGLAAEVADRPGCFLPAKDLCLLTVEDVVRAFREDRADGDGFLRLPADSPTLARFEERFRHYRTALAGIRFADLCRPATADAAAEAPAPETPRT
jgi:membrane protein